MQKSLINFFKNIPKFENNSSKNLILPYSKGLILLLKVAVKEGYLLRYKVQNNNSIKIYLKLDKLKVILLSNANKKKFIPYKKLITFIYKNPLDSFLLFTTDGFLTGKEALSKHLGGHLICKISMLK